MVWSIVKEATVHQDFKSGLQAAGRSSARESKQTDKEPDHGSEWMSKGIGTYPCIMSDGMRGTQSQPLVRLNAGTGG